MIECKKVKFSNEAATDFYIKKLRATSHRKKKPVRGYLCPDCLSWHLTSRTEKDNDLIENLHKAIKTKNLQITQLNQRISELKSKIRLSNQSGPRMCDQSNVVLPTQKVKHSDH